MKVIAGVVKFVTARICSIFLEYLLFFSFSVIFTVISRLGSGVRVGLGSGVRIGFRVRVRIRVRVGFRVVLGLHLVQGCPVPSHYLIKNRPEGLKITNIDLVFD